MKNILLTVIAFLVVLITILTMFNGIHIGNFQILSIGQIIEKSKDLDGEIEGVNTLNNVTYKKYLSDINEKVKALLQAKTKYLDIASTSTDQEIKNANQEEAYAEEYLWSKIGNHATGNGVVLKIEVTPTGVSNKNILSFTAQGEYMSIRDFVYALENDSDLNFTIEGFKLVKGSSEKSLVGTFTVADVGIKPEKTTTSVKENKTTDTKAKNEVKTSNNNSLTSWTDLSNTQDIAAERIDNAIR